MAELTKRGAEDRRREEEQMAGEPVRGEPGDGPPANVPRDKGVVPAADARGDEKPG